MRDEREIRGRFGSEGAIRGPPGAIRGRFSARWGPIRGCFAQDFYLNAPSVMSVPGQVYRGVTHLSRAYAADSILSF